MRSEEQRCDATGCGGGAAQAPCNARGRAGQRLTGACWEDLEEEAVVLDPRDVEGVGHRADCDDGRKDETQGYNVGRRCMRLAGAVPVRPKQCQRKP